jgi:hypothetical protein
MRKVEFAEMNNQFLNKSTNRETHLSYDAKVSSSIIEKYNKYNPILKNVERDVKGFINEVFKYNANPKSSFYSRPIDFARFQMEASINCLYGNIRDKIEFKYIYSTDFGIRIFNAPKEGVPLVNGNDLLYNTKKIIRFLISILEMGEKIIAVNIILRELESGNAHLEAKCYVGTFYRNQLKSHGYAGSGVLGYNMFDGETPVQACLPSLCTSNVPADAAFTKINKKLFVSPPNFPAYYLMAFWILNDWQINQPHDFEGHYLDPNPSIGWTTFGVQHKIWHGTFPTTCFHDLELNTYLAGARFVYNYFWNQMAPFGITYYYFQLHCGWTTGPPTWIADHWIRWGTCQCVPIGYST